MCRSPLRTRATWPASTVVNAFSSFKHPMRIRTFTLHKSNESKASQPSRGKAGLYNLEPPACLVSHAKYIACI